MCICIKVFSVGCVKRFEDKIHMFLSYKKKCIFPKLSNWIRPARSTMLKLLKRIQLSE